MTRSNRLRLFGVCFVKNEEDIIVDSVTHAAQFCDKVFVVDNASTDRTWDVVKELNLGNVVPICSKDFLFRDHLRLRFMDTKKEELGTNNWWYMFDADEFLFEDPFSAIAVAEEEGADCIGVEIINFLLTKDEANEGNKSCRQESWRDCKYYVPYASGTVKLFKNTRYIDYGTYAYIPLGLTKECSRRLIMKHYPHRSLAQLAKRVDIRYGNPEFESECRRGTDLEQYTIDPIITPGLHRCDKENGLDLTGGFHIIVPRLGESKWDRTFSAIIHTLDRLRLLRAFYAFYRRYAAWRQKIDLKNEPKF
jgi:glycosyltransferase involved in cell wall biosynthesis